MEITINFPDMTSAIINFIKSYPIAQPFWYLLIATICVYMDIMYYKCIKWLVCKCINFSEYDYENSDIIHPLTIVIVVLILIPMNMMFFSKTCSFLF